VFSRVIIIILDACGVGELPDARLYGDCGAATLPNLAREFGGLNMPICGRLGLGNIVPIAGIPPSSNPLAGYGKMTEISPGKDSTSGHWEIGGIILEKPFPLYPDGFPANLVAEFEHRAGIKTIGNIAASGTEIIQNLGQKHLETGAVILYTSADSVFQLAAHEDIISLDRLYDICHIARQLLQNEHAVGRVIARPFVGTPGNFARTENRRDFSLPPPTDTFLDRLHQKSIPTAGIGKIYDLFAGRGIARAVKTGNNRDVMNKLSAELNITHQGCIFANLVDFDMLWGHRNDAQSFAQGLEQFDRWLESFLGKLSDNDLLIITADHGCDPTMKNSTDHTREYVPLLVYNKDIAAGVSLGTRKTFADIAATIDDIFELDGYFKRRRHGIMPTSFLKEIVQCLG
jgi:phosphopentomutase